MMLKDPLRLGVVGAGSISLRGLLPHLTMADVRDQVQVTAICDPVLERAQAAAAKFEVPQAFAHYEDLLAARLVDALTIASPIGFHYEQGKLAIEQGLHVHFNKTMTTTAAEADDLIGAANSRGVKLVASPGEMIHPLKQRMRRLVLDGALGTITWAMTGATFGDYHQNERVRQGDDVLTNINPAWYFRRPGGGPLYDMTVYGLHALTGILGPARRVTAFSGIRLAERAFRGEMLPVDMDDNTLMVLDFGNSLFAFVYGVAAGRLPAEGRALSIMGTKGVIHGNLLNGEPIVDPAGAHDPANWSSAALPHVVGPHREMLEEAHVFEDVMQLVDWVREGKSSLATAEHARHVIDIFESAYRSAQSGQAQELRTTFAAIS